MTGPIRRLIPALACLLAGGALAEMTHEGEVGGETWSPADGTHFLRGDVTIAAGTKLTILPGSQVVAKSGDAQAAGLDAARIEIVVRGELLAEGAKFSAEGVYCGPTTSCIAAWHGIVVEPQATAVALRGATIDNARFAGVHYRHPGSVLDVRDAMFSNLAGSSRIGPLIEGVGVHVEAGEPVIDAATFRYSNGITATAGGRPLVRNCSFTEFTYRALTVAATDATAAPVRFVNNRMRTPYPVSDLVHVMADATAAVEIANNAFLRGGVTLDAGSAAILALATNLYADIALAGNVAPGPGSVEGAETDGIDRGTARADVPHDRRGRARPSGRAFDIGPDESARMIPGDADGDGRSALFWRESAPGTGLSWWRMDGGAVQASNYFEVPAEWRIAAVRDFDGDAKADILWRRETDGALYLWKLDGLAPAGYFDLGAPDPAAWALEGVADFDADGRADLLWRRKSDGLAYLWFMEGATIREQGAIGAPVGTQWAVAGVGDLDGDGAADVLWRRTNDGLHYGWRMAGRTIVSQHALGVVDAAEYTAVAIADFDGDSVADIAWRHASGAHSAWTMSGFAVTGSIELASPGAAYEAAATPFLDGLPRAGVAWRDGAGGLAWWRLGAEGFVALPDPGGAWELVAP
ncbi:MAG TPA: VCBS repeat-containing protein [Usitatibacteraceae bacterium]|jgi:hypothetical protein|nr:VCBS repeat-containing protein [Usitatibacteraceae bacterium]HRA24655.1 VCBS repeat-containing protein [Usitatibacteraceae bacterium]